MRPIVVIHIAQHLSCFHRCLLFTKIVSRIHQSTTHSVNIVAMLDAAIHLRVYIVQRTLNSIIELYLNIKYIRYFYCYSGRRFCRNQIYGINSMSVISHKLNFIRNIGMYSTYRMVCITCVCVCMCVCSRTILCRLYYR